MFKCEELPGNYAVLLAVKIGCLCQEVTVTKLFSTDNILKIQKGQNFGEGTKGKDVDEEH